MPTKSCKTKTTDPSHPPIGNDRSDNSQQLDTDHRQPSETNRCDRKRSRSFGLGMGLGVILLAVGSALLVALSVPAGFLPPSIGSLAVILIALGTLSIGTAGDRICVIDLLTR